MQDQTFEVKVHFGTVEVVPEVRLTTGGVFIGGGYKIVRDEDGNVTERTAWEPNGLVLTQGAEEPGRPWWKFWG